MDLRITPHKLSGKVCIPASKSMAHRAIICASLAIATSRITGVSFSRDIDATLGVIEALGATFEIRGDEIYLTGIRKANPKVQADCGESGSTLRFLIPIAAAFGAKTTFSGEGRLPSRPITPYVRELTRKGVGFSFPRNATMPFTTYGKLLPGIFELEGDISSQFITGLLLALPLLRGDSEIRMLSPLQSKPYADMTIACMERFGVHVTETPKGYAIHGRQFYQAQDFHVEGDFSQAAFFFTANAIGNLVDIRNLPENSMQGDRKIVEILDEMWYNKNETLLVDATDIPDLVPILAVAASLAPRPTRICGAERLRIKESDRLATTAAMLQALGGKVSVRPDGLDITPVDGFTGGVVDCAGDHRIAMCAAIAATRASSDVILRGSQCVEKSYPAFFADYQSLGGVTNGISLD